MRRSLNIRKLRHKEVTLLVHSRSASEWWTCYSGARLGSALHLIILSNTPQLPGDIVMAGLQKRKLRAEGQVVTPEITQLGLSGPKFWALKHR